jgi:pyridoxine/pyridoxamine 5'-phosphate oxidase
MKPDLPREAVKDTVASFISKQRYGVVSSISDAGLPQSAVVGIASTNEMELIFDTLTSTRKYRNLSARPRCAFVLYAGEQTLQFEGSAFEPRGEELARYQEIYFSAWPECREHLSWPGLTHLVVKPVWMRFSDYDQKPALIEEITLP